jgi:hypothetical protein
LRVLIFGSHPTIIRAVQARAGGLLPQASEVRLHFLLPLVGAVAGLLGVALCSALMLVGSGSVSAPRRLTR